MGDVAQDVLDVVRILVAGGPFHPVLDPIEDDERPELHRVYVEPELRRVRDPRWRDG